MSTFELVVTEGQHVDRTLATASWYDVHQLKPGVYPINFLNVRFQTPIEGHESYDTRQPYWAVVKVPSTLVESYRVSRLFTASSSETKHPMTDDVVTVQAYHYQIKDGACLLGEWQTEQNENGRYERFVQLGVVREIA